MIELTINGTPTKVKVARRGKYPAFVDNGTAVLACIPGHPKETMHIPINDLPF